METRKSYNQFCALARALDHVGDRWVLLIVRELLLGVQSFRALQRALPGIAPNVLVARLRVMEQDGLVERNDVPARSKAVAYTLTEAGLALRPAVLELIRWGARWMPSGPGDDHVDPRWALLALAALLDGPVPGRHRGVIEVRLGDECLGIELQGGRRRVVTVPPAQSRAVVTGTLPEALAVAGGLVTSEASALKITGDGVLARLALTPGPADREVGEAVTGNQQRGRLPPSPTRR